MARDRLRTVWDGLWFEPRPAADLAAARVIVSIHALWMLLSRDLPALSALPAAFYARVAPDTRWRYLLFEGHPSLERFLEWLAVLALSFVLVGRATKWAALLAALLLYHLAPLQALFHTPSPVHRGLTTDVLALVVLAAGGDGVRRLAPPLAPVGTVPGWPLHLIRLFFLQIYFFSGCGKLLHSGLAWLDPDAMRNQLLIGYQIDPEGALTGLGPLLAKSSVACVTLSGLTLLLELGAPLALVSRRARGAFLVGALAFHLGVLLTLNVYFYNWPQLLLLVDWNHFLRRQLK